MTAGSGEALRQQLEAALHREMVDHGFDGYPHFAPAFRAEVWPLVSAGLAAARADERERIAEAIEDWDWQSDYAVAAIKWAVEGAARIARGSVPAPKGDQ